MSLDEQNPTLAKAAAKPSLEDQSGGVSPVVNVTKATVAELQMMMRDGRIKPYEKLPSQRELASALKVSRATLREALSVLATIGEISVRPGKRGFISSPEGSSEMPSWRFSARYSLSEVYHFRYISESYAAQVAAIKHTPADLVELEESTERFRAAAHSKDIIAYAHADSDFHQSILKISGNKLLIDMNRTFASILVESQILPTVRPGNLWIAVKEHERILEAIAMNDPDGASYFMRKHITMAGSRAGLAVHELP
jgi:GntR family transcriptional repressor for pyruvate dehydrogenase complex